MNLLMVEFIEAVLDDDHGISEKAYGILALMGRTLPLKNSDVLDNILGQILGALATGMAANVVTKNVIICCRLSKTPASMAGNVGANPISISKSAAMKKAILQ